MPTVAETMENAVQRHQDGHLRQAEQLYKLVLQNDPNNPAALHSLGVIAHQRGNHDTAWTGLCRGTLESVACAPANRKAHRRLERVRMATKSWAGYNNVSSLLWETTVGRFVLQEQEASRSLRAGIGRHFAFRAIFTHGQSPRQNGDSRGKETTIQAFTELSGSWWVSRSMVR